MGRWLCRLNALSGIWRSEEGYGTGEEYSRRGRLAGGYIEAFFFVSMYYLRTTFSSSVPVVAQIWGSMHSSPLPTTTVHAFIFMAGRIPHFVPSSTSVEVSTHTGSLVLSTPFLCTRKSREINLTTCEVVPLGQWGREKREIVHTYNKGGRWINTALLQRQNAAYQPLPLSLIHI